MNTAAQMTRVETLMERLQPMYAQLGSHPLYASFRAVEHLQMFMEAHVFAVWDFMSLLKALQRGLTCVDVPWVPSRMPESRRLVNEIVLGEESDVYEGRPASHFEIYRTAMQACGAETHAIDLLLKEIAAGTSVNDALLRCGAPHEAAEFVQNTFRILAEDELHKTAAAFTFGREDLIPEMFKGLVRDLNRELSGKLSIFLWYLERHIEIDGEEHGPMALRMVSELCGDDDCKWQEAEEAAILAIEARLRLWDGIAARIQRN
jgi:hypothetical protein